MSSREEQANEYISNRGDSQTRSDFLAGWDAAVRAGAVAEEPEWGVRHVAVDGWPTVVVHASRQGAEEDFATCGMNCSIVERKVSAWVPAKQERAER